jgi:hypothetical protein
MALGSGCVSIGLATKLNRPIHNLRHMMEPDKKLLLGRDLVVGLLPDAIPRSLDSTYNCMGLVFGSRRTAIDIDELVPILEDDGYREIGDLRSLEFGDVVAYGDDGSLSHVGLIWKPISREPIADYWVISQLGYFGEYFHHIRNVPVEYGRPLKYFTDRRVV